MARFRLPKHNTTLVQDARVYPVLADNQEVINPVRFIVAFVAFFKEAYLYGA